MKHLQCSGLCSTASLPDYDLALRASIIRCFDLSLDDVEEKDVGGDLMVFRRPLKRDPEAVCTIKVCTYSPWDARVERSERKALFWVSDRLGKRRAGLIGRLKHMTAWGAA